MTDGEDIAEAVHALKTAVEVLKASPELLHTPELAFFKEYLVSMGAKIPPAKEKKPAPKVEEVDDDEPLSEEEKEEPLPVDPDVIPESEADVSPAQENGDASKEPSDDDYEKASAVKGEAMVNAKRGLLGHGCLTSLGSTPPVTYRYSHRTLHLQEAQSSGEFETAVAKFTELIKLTPTAANYANRGMCFIKMKKPLAAIRDANKALELNPDSGKAYRVRGLANAQLGRWTDASKDLGQGQKIDYDEGAYEMQKKVSKKLDELHKWEQAAKARAEKAKQRKSKRAAASAAADDDFGSGFPGGMGGFPGMGGM
eukprot:CAMPEP_0113710516 /NCGR_PEP_ID=MMETSP0038_2-20120614/30201_1 /TAXON_ID=2898 /ORGANISM="Cryptomonas paramecium" /LENGTH=311 /DNA_ID=CAMNT_0000636583 /DNA_START=11 /DNA_END=944 /DNA_ORIENTATION=+ /assembly_acc=CAM_ASM_000170